MKFKTRLYVTMATVFAFPGVREIIVWLADRIFNTNFALFYRLWINIAGGFIVGALVIDLLWAAWDEFNFWYYHSRHYDRYPRYKFKKD